MSCFVSDKMRTIFLNLIVIWQSILRAEITRGNWNCLYVNGGKWYEDEVFKIDDNEFEAWNKVFQKEQIAQNHTF